MVCLRVGKDSIDYESIIMSGVLHSYIVGLESCGDGGPERRKWSSDVVYGCRVLWAIVECA